jgi:uncharacterized protein (TIGR02246 family)
MSKLFISLAVLCLLAPAATMARGAADEQPIKDRLNEFQAAWNKDDAKAMAEVFTEDGSLVNPFGDSATSRAEIEKIFTEEHAHPFKGSTYSFTDVKIQWVSDELAVVDLNGNISGVKAADGSAAPDCPHHVTWTMIKKDGKWMGAAARAFQFSAKPGAK